MSRQKITKTYGGYFLLIVHHPKITILVWLSVLHVLFLTSAIQAQPEDRPIRIGPAGGLGSNISRSSIQSFAGTFLCGVFERGSAPGISIFGQAEIPISNGIFSFEPRLGYSDLSSSFVTKPYQIENARDIATGGIFQVFRERNFTTNVKTISADFLFALQPFGGFHLSAGGELALLFHHTYGQSEKLLTAGAVYVDNSLSTHPVSSGNFETKAFIASFVVGTGYDIRLSPRVNLSPEVKACFPITPIATSNGSNYRTWTIGGSIALMYALPTAQHQDQPKITPPEIQSPKPSAPPIVESIPAPAPIAKNVLRVSVKAFGLTETGEEIPEPLVSIENVRVTDVAPTLNYLFFDDGSADIPKRYHHFSNAIESKSFNPANLYKLDALGIHYEVLNILGKRMQEKTNSKITITGTRSLHSFGDSVAAADISLLRAEQTAKYLQDVWDISPSRIRVRSRALPELASDEFATTGQAENRRVEIITNTPSLLEPIETRRIERTATPPKISFHTDVVSSFDRPETMSITIMQAGKVIKKIDALSESTHGEFLWDIAEGNVIGSNDSVTWRMDVLDSAGGTASVTGNIRIKKQEQNSTRHALDTAADKSLERFHLLLFDYSSSAELGNISDDILERIASSITPDSRVSLIGHTDITGDPNYNEHLSYDRASRASILLSTRLHKIQRSAPQFNLEARGAKDLLFDNTNAEGRFLSRTVRITVERDLKKK